MGAAVVIYQRSQEAGVTLTADGERLLATPARLLTDELRADIRAHKPELLALLHDAHETTAALIEAAMRACAHHGDGDVAREQMRLDCLATPLHQRADLQKTSPSA